MAKIKKRGTSGQAKNFITRTQAIRKLQVSLPDFRRLCIFKGIYPREPRNKKKAAKSSTPSTTFYYSKDIQYLLHEPLLNKFREHKALSKKIARSLGKGEIGDAVRYEKSGIGKITLDHVIKERYPTFVDALRDLDDALSMLFLFASLPSSSNVPPKTIALCQRLCLEFQHYVIVSHSLRKSFLSVKGIYYQVTIQGQDIMWLVPYRFVQRVTGDVDFRIMGTFVEFYTTLLGFVNFRLYTTVGLIYPPRFDSTSDERSGELGAFKLEGRGFDDSKNNQDMVDTDSQTIGKLQSKVDEITAQAINVADTEAVEDEETTEFAIEKIDEFKPTGEGADTLPQPQLSNFDAASLFAPFTFFLSRETPRQPLEFILRAFGCKRVGWDIVLGDGAFTNTESNPAITHQIIDRPALTTAFHEPIVNSGDATEEADPGRIRPGYRVPGRIYVQPQWVWDCINAGKLLRPDLYAPGATLPPHLSPWMKPRKGAYNPSLPLEEQEREGEADEFEEEEAEAALITANQDSQRKSSSENSITGKDHDNIDILASTEEGPEDADVRNGSEDGIASFDENSRAFATQNEDEIDQHQADLEAEAAGLPFSARHDKNSSLSSTNRSLDGAAGNQARRKAARRKQEEEDELQRRLGMMSRKKRQQMEKMLQSQHKDVAEAEALRKKRRKLERHGGGAKTQ